MTELDLYKYIAENNIEHNYVDDSEIYIFLYYFQIEGFVDILEETVFDDTGIECIMQMGYVAINVVPICDYYGIDPAKIFRHHK